MIKIIRKFLIVICLSFTCIGPAQAISKLDFSEPAGGFMVKIEKLKEKIEQKYNEAMETLNAKMRKVFGAEGAALFQNYISKVSSQAINSLLSGSLPSGDFGFNDVTKNMLSQLGNFKLDLANLSSLALDYEKALQQEKIAKTRVMNTQLVQWEAERELINNQLSQEQDEENSKRLLAKLEDLDINITNMQGQIRKVEAEDKLKDEKLTEMKAEMMQFKTLIGDLNAKKSSEDLIKTLNDQISNLFNKDQEDDIDSVYQANIDRLFLGEDDYVGGDNLAVIDKNRRQEYYEALKNMAREYINTLKDIKDSEEKSDKCVETFQKADGVSGQQTLQICVDLQSARVAAGQVQLLLAELRFKAISDIQKWNDEYKLRSYSADPTKFNLDNYIFTKDDLKQRTNALKGFVNNYK